ncbi:hypothetical protein GCM10027053_03720 [Intrasporangium mesophilum]
MGAIGPSVTMRQLARLTGRRRKALWPMSPPEADHREQCLAGVPREVGMVLRARSAGLDVRHLSEADESQT